MDDLLWLFAASAIIAALLANIGLWSPRRVWVKLTAMGLVIAFLPTAYASFVSLLSRPKHKIGRDGRAGHAPSAMTNNARHRQYQQPGCSN